MSNRTTYVINFIAQPGSGKSSVSASLFSQLKCHEKLKRKKSVEYIQEYAKQLVWTKNWDALNDQHYVSRKQYGLLKQMDGLVDIIVCDYSLLNGLYYNRFNPDNVSDVEKTHKYILDRYNEFVNINIFLNRGDFEYETEGRIQTEDEATQVGIDMKRMLQENNIYYTEFTADLSSESMTKLVNFVIRMMDE